MYVAVARHRFHPHVLRQALHRLTLHSATTPATSSTFCTWAWGCASAAMAAGGGAGGGGCALSSASAGATAAAAALQCTQELIQRLVNMLCRSHGTDGSGEAVAAALTRALTRALTPRVTT